MWLMLFTHYLFGYVGKQTCQTNRKHDANELLGTAICSIGLVLALCSVYIFTRRQMVNLLEDEDKLD